MPDAADELTPEPLSHLRMEQPDALGFWSSLFYLFAYGLLALIPWLFFMATDSLVVKLVLAILFLMNLLSAFGTFWDGWGGEGRPTAMYLDRQGLRLSSAWWDQSYPQEALTAVEYDDGLLMLATNDGHEWRFVSAAHAKAPLKAFFASLGLTCEEDSWNYLRMVRP